MAFLWVFAPLSFAVEQQRNLGVAAASGDKRVALVIGNAAYPGSGALKNPANDARDIAAKLRKLGFDVIVRTDVKQKDMLRSLTEFGDKVQTGTEALFFYAGHGMQVRGKNFLIPIDAEIRNESSVSSEAVDVDQLLDKLSLARLSLVILDACRNNPFERRFRGGGQGLAQINAPTGTLIAYATAPGKVAADGEGRNGLYTSELLAAMDVPGIRIEDVFKRVRANVVKKSGEAQTPWESSSLTGDFYFLPGIGGQGNQTAQAAQGFTPAASVAATGNADDALWYAVEKSGSADDYDVYLSQYPKGKYAALAKSRKSRLQDQVAQEGRQREADKWAAAERGNSAESYAAYLKDYPGGQYAPLAKTRKAKLDEEKEVREERQLWEKASAGKSRTALKAYLARFPSGTFSGSANEKLEAMKENPLPQELPAALGGEVWTAVKNSEAYRNMPDAKAVKVKIRKVSTWPVSGGGQDRSVNEYEKEVTDLGSGVLRSQYRYREGTQFNEAYLVLGRIGLYTVFQNQPSGRITHIEIKGSHFPLRVGAEEHIKYQTTDLFNRGKFNGSGEHRCRIGGKLAASSIHPQFAGDAWVVDCEAKYANSSYSTSGELRDYFIESIGLYLSSFGESDAYRLDPDAKAKVEFFLPTAGYTYTNKINKTSVYESVELTVDQ